MAQPIMSHHAMQSGTYCSFASDEPCAHILDYHSYLTHLYLPFAIYNFPPDFRLRSSYSLIALPTFSQHAFTSPFTFAMLHFTPQSHHLCLSHTCHYHTWRQFLTPWSHPQSLIGFMLRLSAPSNLSCAHHLLHCHCQLQEVL